MDIFCPLLLDAMAILLTNYSPLDRSLDRSRGGLCDVRCSLETVMIIEFNSLSIAMGEWEKEKKQIMTAMVALW